jgi:hypothetical protein
MKSIIFIFVLFGAFSCFAQPFTIDEKIKPTELKLTDFAGSSSKEKGRIALVTVTQKDDSLYFFVKGISIYSPIMVYADSLNKQDKLQISLHKDLWTEVEKSGVTDADGFWSSTFKTGSDFGIKISTPKKPVKYELFVWVGDEVKVDVPTPFKKRKAIKGEVK